jgi:hypothetical protein
MFGPKDLIGPARFGSQTDFQVVAEAFVELTVFDKAIKLVTLSENADLRTGFEGEIGEKQQARFPQFLQVSTNVLHGITSYRD